MSSLDQGFLTRTSKDRFPKCPTPGFSSWVCDWICSREQKCSSGRCVVSSSVWFWHSQSWSPPLVFPEQPVPEEGEPVRNLVEFHGKLHVRQEWECVMRHCPAWHRGTQYISDFSGWMSTELSVPSDWKTALAQTRQNLLLCRTLQGTVMQISCKGAVTSDKLDFS